MRGESESTKKVKRLFDELRAEGMSHPEIAKYCGVSVRHYYNVLEDIAKERGVSKKDLLDRVQKKHAPFEHVSREALKAMDPEEFNKHCDKAIAEIDEMLGSIGKFIAEEKELSAREGL